MDSQLCSTTDSYTRGILYEYMKVLSGESPGYSLSLLGKKCPNNEKNARLILAEAFRVFLRWTPEDVANRLTKDILRDLKLLEVLPFLGLPDDYFNSGDYTMLAAVLYPGQLVVGDSTLTVNTYKMVLLGRDNGGMYRFPKKYFDGNVGLHRAYVCMRYLVSNYTIFHSTREMYEFFSSPAGSQLINTHGLKLVLRDVFHSPVRFLHESLYDEEKDDFWYHYYEFLYQYNKGKKLVENFKKAESSIAK